MQNKTKKTVFKCTVKLRSRPVVFVSSPVFAIKGPLQSCNTSRDLSRVLKQENVVHICAVRHFTVTHE